MREERGVAVVAYRKPHGEERFLVLKRTKNWEGWELPKGHLEEDEEETVKLELEEEAGIDEDEILDIQKMDYFLEWEYEDGDEKVKRKYRGFIVKVSDGAVVDVSGNPHEEHETGHFFNERDAEKLLTYEEHVELLKKAINSLKED